MDVVGDEALAISETAGVWSVTSLPDLPVENGWQSVEAEGISCVGAQCTVVGYGTTSGGAKVPAAWSWNGSWTMAALPLDGATTAALGAVSCSDDISCTAIGIGGPSDEETTFVAVETNGVWTSRAKLTGASFAIDFPMGISCWAEQRCMAVAMTEETNSSLATAISVTDLSVQYTRLSQPTGRTTTLLDAIDCAGPTSCLAVGAASGDAFTENSPAPLTATWNGTAWTEAVNESDNASASGVSCEGSTPCLEVGQTTARAPYAATVTSSHWEDDSPVIGGAPIARLSGVSCPAATVCVAAGTFVSPVTAQDMPLVEVDDDGTWSMSVPPLPASVENGQLTSISCASDTSCVAVGDSAPESAVGATTWPFGAPFADVLSNGVWRAKSLPMSKDWDQAAVTGVSCAGATHCVAIADSELPDSTAGPVFVDQLSGTTWHESVPTVSADWRATAFSSVSCGAIDQCVAVGERALDSKPVEGVVYRLDGTTWTAAAVVTPEKRPGVPTSVACVSAQVCEIVGGYTVSAGSNGVAPFADEETADGVWHTTALNGTAPLDALGCNAQQCVAQEATSGAPLTSFVFSQGSWNSATTALPGPWSEFWLGATACSTSGACLAVGSAYDESSSVPMIVQFG